MANVDASSVLHVSRGVGVLGGLDQVLPFPAVPMLCVVSPFAGIWEGGAWMDAGLGLGACDG